MKLIYLIINDDLKYCKKYKNNSTNTTPCVVTGIIVATINKNVKHTLPQNYLLITKNVGINIIIVQLKIEILVNINKL